MSKGRMVAVFILSAVAFYAGLVIGNRLKAAEDALTDTVLFSERLGREVELLSLLSAHSKINPANQVQSAQAKSKRRRVESL